MQFEWRFLWKRKIFKAEKSFQSLSERNFEISPDGTTQPTNLTPPKFNSSPLKNGGWKTILSYWECNFFRGKLAVKLPEIIHANGSHIHLKSTESGWCALRRPTFWGSRGRNSDLNTTFSWFSMSMFWRRTWLAVLLVKFFGGLNHPKRLQYSKTRRAHEFEDEALLSQGPP